MIRYFTFLSWLSITVFGLFIYFGYIWLADSMNFEVARSQVTIWSSHLHTLLIFFCIFFYIIYELFAQMVKEAKNGVSYDRKLNLL